MLQYYCFNLQILYYIKVKDEIYSKKMYLCGSDFFEVKK